MNKVAINGALTSLYVVSLGGGGVSNAEVKIGINSAPKTILANAAALSTCT